MGGCERHFHGLWKVSVFSGKTPLFGIRWTQHFRIMQCPLCCLLLTSLHLVIMT